MKLDVAARDLVARTFEDATFQESSLDLVLHAQKLIWFLQELHSRSVTLKTPSPKSLERYTNFWLPLVAHSGQKMLPPPDIAWLWHCHRLAPMVYEKYVKSRFGKLLEANPPFKFQDENATSSVALLTRDAWSNQYPDEPFFLEKTDTNLGEASTDARSSFLVGGFDLAGSAMRQNTFLYQVSTPQFQDIEFLMEGESRYYKFLSLKADHHLVPTFEIDLMWHAHMLSSIERYNRDCLAIRGEKFHHDDSFDDRTPGAALHVAFTRTSKLWAETYGEEYAVQGAMYRGEPPSSYFDANWTPNFSTKFVNVSCGAHGTITEMCAAAGCGGGCGGSGCGGMAAGCGGGCGGGGCGGY